MNGPVDPYATSGLLSRGHRLLIISRPHKQDTLWLSGTSLKFVLQLKNLAQHGGLSYFS